MISPAFETDAKTNIICLALLSRLQLYFNTRELLRKNNLYGTYLFNVQEELFQLNASDNYYFRQACNYLINISLNDKTYFLIKSDNDIKCLTSIIEDKFPLATRNVLLYSRLAFYQYSNFLNASIVLNKYFPERVNNERNKKENSLFDTKEQFVMPDGNVISADKIMNNLRGKIVIIDIWASWCGPCRKEIPHSKKLNKLYSSRNVAVIYLSIDTDILAWQKALKQEALPLENNFLLLDKEESFFIRKNYVRVIPRYLVVDKQGNVYNNDAPRPSDPKLIQLLNMLTNK